MKLHYFHGRGPLRHLVMINNGQRVELHIRPVTGGLWGLVALTGPDQGQPEGQLRRGPWKTQARAESVLRSVAGTLMERGFEPCPTDYVVWSVAAQRLVRLIDTGTAATASSLETIEFDPLA